MSKASQSWQGSRAYLRALEALAFLALKYAFSHFSWYFFFKIFYEPLCGYDKYMKDSEHFSKCNFPFLYLRQSRVLFIHLLLLGDTLLCKRGVWGPRSCHILNCQICILPLFLALFLQKFSLDLCRYIHKKSFSI